MVASPQTSELHIPEFIDKDKAFTIYGLEDPEQPGIDVALDGKGRHTRGNVGHRFCRRKYHLVYIGIVCVNVSTKLLRLALGIAGLVPALTPTSALAKAPMVRTQPPAFYRFMLGDFEVTVLSDGTIKVPLDKLLSINPDGVRKSLTSAYRTPEYEMSFNCFLINTGSKLILVDAGGGRLLGPTLGKLVRNMKASGYLPEQIDEVLLTHMHEDHVGGLFVDGKRVFPNAVVRADKDETDFWLARGGQSKARKDIQRFFPSAVAAITPYMTTGQFRSFVGDVQLEPGISALATHGHTAGHTVYVVESKGQRLELWGDLVHAAEIQLPDPTITIQFDSEPVKAAEQRAKELASAAKAGFIVGATHISFPGIGHFQKANPGYAWIPLPYSTTVEDTASTTSAPLANTKPSAAAVR